MQWSIECLTTPCEGQSTVVDHSNRSEECVERSNGEMNQRRGIVCLANGEKFDGSLIFKFSLFQIRKCGRLLALRDMWTENMVDVFTSRLDQTILPQQPAHSVQLASQAMKSQERNTERRRIHLHHNSTKSVQLTFIAPNLLFISKINEACSKGWFLN